MSESLRKQLKREGIDILTEKDEEEIKRQLPPNL